MENARRRARGSRVGESGRQRDEGRVARARGGEEAVRRSWAKGERGVWRGRPTEEGARGWVSRDLPPGVWEEGGPRRGVEPAGWPVRTGGDGGAAGYTAPRPEETIHGVRGPGIFTASHL